MDIERWKDTTSHIKDTFEVEDEGSEHIDEEGGIDVDYIVFAGPLGKMRLEYVSRPAILDKKTTYSNRIGSETKIDYTYSKTDRSQQMMAYKWDEGLDDWVEMESKMFA
ncbi:hypothetical protein L6270_05155 [Candidatus Parcubacteria bacterium]|nr:hypothetical protein [Patescibacteria group bacterium]MBU4309348.1 hypothetical protein [Patescibacteria group bacterium]MBU4431844.1 hypothetical protein [Patescibacteria group bacterium]MBU4577709.1 hypothetical protein [Patescibacteria group bacterium]MCG2697395.1 hypothetical protein [Candidatus Parcubacteria bacterium]